MSRAPLSVGNLLVIGLGLIGGSLVAALRKNGVEGRFSAWNRNLSTLEYALSQGLIDEIPVSLEQAVSQADIIVVGVPTLAVGDVFEVIAANAKPDVIVTDAASVKGSVIDAAAQAFGHIPPNFVPGHPIAGSEQSGVEASKADLYVNHRVILTPLANTSEQALATVQSMWQACGAQVVSMDVETHDRVLALTSHLPHLLAFGLVDTLAKQNDSDDIFRFAAGGFRDFTRIASSDVTMWRDICLANREALLDALDLFQSGLLDLRQAISDLDADALTRCFSDARSARQNFLKLLEPL